MLRRDEGGASLVEFALVMPLILMLLLGLVSAGVAYNEKITLTHAARETARYGAILPTAGATPTWLGKVEARLLTDAAGLLDVGQPDAKYCIAYVDGSDSIAQMDGSGSGGETKNIDESKTVQDGWCFDDTRGVGEWRVQIQASRDTDFNALFFSRTITLGTSAVSRYEVMAGG